MSKTACRKALTKTLLEIAEKSKKIVVLTSDARGSVTLNDFAAVLPEQFVEVGIAEQDEIGVAAGMAACGLIPFVCAPAPFLSARSLEQIKVDVSYSNTNVKICGVSGGLSYGALGGSHHSIHDLAAVRPMENMTVLMPADAAQTGWMVKTIAETEGPVYMRMGRNGVEDIYTEEDVSCFEIGKAHLLREGRDITLIAAGEMVWYAKCAAEMLQEENISARVLDMHTIKPLDTGALRAAAEETGYLVTIEEHSVCGGLGSAVAEYICQNCPVPVKILGIPDEHVIAGDSPEVFAHYGLDGGGIAKTVRELLNKQHMEEKK